MDNKESIKVELKELVTRFESHKMELHKSFYNETQTRIEYINPFLQLFGWDVQNSLNHPKHLKDVIHEDTVEIDQDLTELGSILKKPDYSLNINGERKLFVEAKKPSVNLLNNADSAFQIRRYGWSACMRISIITNFEQLVIYDCRIKPNKTDTTVKARVKHYTCDEYIDKFDEIYELLSKDSLRTGILEQKFPIEEDQTTRGVEFFDSYFLKQIENWRKLIGQDISKHNNLSNKNLNLIIQKLINRIIFLRICEDRNLEKYNSLFKISNIKELYLLFSKAELKYNSGIFELIENEKNSGLKITDEIVINIFKELYYPESPYAFSVVEANVIGQIYERFLAYEVISTSEGLVTVEQKPEIIISNGIISTPQIIAEKIVEDSLIEYGIEEKFNKDIDKFKIIDIACGSGIFLLAAYNQLLIKYYDYYITKPEHSSKITRNMLTFETRKDILVRHIYGVDIDPMAVEVSRFSLLIKLIEDSSVEELIAHQPILPNLKKNILCGNSLVDPDQIINENIGKLEIIEKINPFSWKSLLQDLNDTGFDIIIGNPPYVRIQSMIKYAPEETHYYSNNHYKTAKSNNYDKYFLFIERAIDLLKKDGILSFITSNKFISIKAGESLRKLISESKFLVSILNFGAIQVFKNRSTYTCVLVIKKNINTEFKYATANSIIDYTEKRIQFKTENQSVISNSPWILLPDIVKHYINNLNGNSEKLGSLVDIFVGLQTSADKIYIINPLSEKDGLLNIAAINGNEYWIEKKLTREFLNDQSIKSFGKIESNSRIIFPYEEKLNGLNELIPWEKLLQSYPHCSKYFVDMKSELVKRSIKNINDKNWYSYGRSQSLNKFNKPKILIRVVTSFPQNCIDYNNVLVTGGGNGPYYNIKLKNGSNISLDYIVAILNHPLIEFLIRKNTSWFDGGFYSHGKQFIENLPLVNPNENDLEKISIYNKIIETSKKLQEVTNKLQTEEISFNIESLERIATSYKQKLDQEINELYQIPDEVYQFITNSEYEI